MPKLKTEYELLDLLKKYIVGIKKGKHLQKNGNKIKASSQVNYKYLVGLLTKFSEQKQFTLRIKTNIKTRKEHEDERKYWADFYKQFTDYLYFDLNHYDNYVGATIKLLKAFFNYLNTEAGMNTGNYYKKFFVTSEESEIIVLSPERINFLITNQELQNKLSDSLEKTKDVFVFGCTVGLRYSDLVQLTRANIEHFGSNIYFSVRSKKTQTYTKVKLPDYAIDILDKYKLKNGRLLPYFNKVLLNKKIKELMEIAEFTEPVNKVRRKRGVPVNIYKNGKRQTPYRFCDLVSTHTMRRTAITTMLSLGMKEQMVRKISGHAPGSKEFHRYVSFSQMYLDNEIDLVHKKLLNG